MSRREQVHYRRHVVGFVRQQTARNLVPYLSARQTVDLPLTIAGRPRAERRDRARTLLDLGRTMRRRKKWRAARAALDHAAAAFDELGSPGWAEAARSELVRVAGRKRRAEGELTETEHRVAELAARGLSNKEIAQAMVVTVATVETHLSKAYAKLGVRSRTQLAARLSGLG
jgi:ATP/maltotriose-dependent transcriptional regulator MalT